MKSGLFRKRSNIERTSILGEYEVTYTPIKYKYIKALPESVQDEIGELFILTRENPGQAIPKLERMIKQYPQIPQMYNFLSTAYSLMGDYAQSEAYAVECCKKHPDYLFSKINYAEICLRKNQFEKIPGIFNHRLNLGLLYPERNVFHFTEVVAFSAICGLYYCMTNDRDAAEDCYKIVNGLSPKSSYTKRLRSKLYPSTI